MQTTVTLLNTTRLLEPPIVATIPGALTFTSGNWNTRQRVLVRSMGDNVDHDMERFRIDHAITTTDAVFSEGSSDSAPSEDMPSVFYVRLTRFGGAAPADRSGNRSW